MPPAGGPRASPTQSQKSFLRTVGEGLKVNRPKAERSHPGVCPRRRSSERNPLTGGPVWDRPLRRSPDRLLYFCRGDPCGRPPAQVLRHPLPGLAAAGEVVQAHVKKVSQGQELRIFWAARAGFIVLIGPQGFSKSVTNLLLRQSLFFPQNAETLR